MNNYIDVALGTLRDALPEGEKMSVAIFMGMVELMKGTSVGSQKYYSQRVFSQLRNIRELTRAAENGVELEDLQEAVDILRRPENAFRNIRLVEDIPQKISFFAENTRLLRQNTSKILVRWPK